MSLHANLTPEAQSKLAAQKRNSTITSIIIALLVCTLLGIILWIIALVPTFKNNEETVSYSANSESDTEVTRPEMTNEVETKPSAPASSMARVIAAKTPSPTAVPVPDITVTEPSLDFGDGNDFGEGWGSGSGNGAGNGGGGSFFGSTRPGNGLKGIFYDFKRDRRGKPNGVKAQDRATFTKIIKEFTKSSRWSPPSRYSHYTSPTKLYAKSMIFKGIPDTAAGKAFQAPDTKAGLWLAHYEGHVTSLVTGNYNLVGWGDNCLIIAINGKIVLDASDVGYTGVKRTAKGRINIPGKPSAMMFQGSSFKLRKGSKYKIDILVGDEGGIFSAGSAFVPAGKNYPASSGVPNFPAFVVSPLAPKQFNELGFIRKPHREPTVIRIK